ncbi:replication-associated recombination protein A [Derxia lacustris]|uniref:Replication-associated recombination protein A n=1 Tax=Derxia gummosa DSM 723 TaxID=1121388 RepID=A0AC36KJ63_9BURK|nr:replication-associated recombination protein A [Derxia lacustris]
MRADAGEARPGRDAAARHLSQSAPLAERLRPHTIADVIGQRHLLGEGKPLAVAFASGRPHSMILWGPPGVGKTTLARLMADAFGCAYIALSAVLAGVKDIREAVATAQATRDATGRQTLLFIDEIHRFNKSQQDALLPHVESGLFVFVGATTENPSFEVNSALLSRAAVYVLASLDEPALGEMIDRAIAAPEAPELHGIVFEPKARELLLRSSDGDGRKLLNNLEIVARAIPAPRAATAGQGSGAEPAADAGAVAERAAEEPPARLIDEAVLARALSENLRRFDKGGEAFYDSISALHKSVRGSQPDASLYWFCRMLDGGVDPRYLARRLIRMANEDIGLADPRAIEVTLAAADTYERLGSPEGELALAQALVYLAVAPKSNAVYTAYKAAMRFVKEDGSRPVPLHLRNAPTKLMKNLGYGHDYRYAHDEPNAYAAGETYFPDGMREPSFYTPTPRGLEARIAERLAYWRGLDDEARGNEPSSRGD